MPAVGLLRCDCAPALARRQHRNRSDFSFILCFIAVIFNIRYLPPKISNSKQLPYTMKDFFVKWYNYNAWANDRVLTALQQQRVEDEKILTLMNHILTAQFLWLNRIESLPPPEHKLWSTQKISRLREMATEAANRWNTFIASHEKFSRQMTYHNYTGDLFTNDVEQIMIHVVNHGTYHRGQIAMRLRELGLEPVNTDYITYERVLTGQLKP